MSKSPLPAFNCRSLRIPTSQNSNLNRVVVLNKGTVAADGTPQAVFSQVQLLHDIGLAAPETVELCWKLNQLGANLPLNGLTPNECAQTLFENWKV